MRRVFPALPRRRRLIDGRGGIAFTEVTSVLHHADTSPLAPTFPAYLLEPETAIRAAFVEGTCNPVAQLGEPRVFNAAAGSYPVGQSTRGRLTMCGLPTHAESRLFAHATTGGSSAYAVA